MNKTQQYTYLYINNLIDFYNLPTIKLNERIAIRIPHNKWLQYYGYNHINQIRFLYGAQTKI